MAPPPVREIREATPDDAEALLAIYAPIVRDTAISFESSPPSVVEFGQRISEGRQRYPWLLASTRDGIAGYAYAAPFRSRAAYRATAEVTIYTSPDHHRRGVGRRLYEALLDGLRRCLVHTAVAAVARPNPVSESFHRALGFEPAGVVPRAGYKHGAWHDVAFYSLFLQPDDAYREPIDWSDLPEPRLGS